MKEKSELDVKKEAIMVSQKGLKYFLMVDELFVKYLIPNL